MTILPSIKDRKNFDTASINDFVLKSDIDILNPTLDKDQFTTSILSALHEVRDLPYEVSSDDGNKFYVIY